MDREMVQAWVLEPRGGTGKISGGYLWRCKHCKEMFVGRKDARYCSGNCRKYAHTKKQRKKLKKQRT